MSLSSPSSSTKLAPPVWILPKATQVSVLDTAVSDGAYLLDVATRDSWHRLAIGAETGVVAAAYVAEVRPAVQVRERGSLKAATVRC